MTAEGRGEAAMKALKLTFCAITAVMSIASLAALANDHDEASFEEDKLFF